MKNLLVVLLLAWLAWFAFGKFRPAQLPSRLEASPPSTARDGEIRPPSRAESPFKCDGRTMCPQMTSCAEATYFIQHCPNTKMDGNNDGVPCERQWCN